MLLIRIALLNAHEKKTYNFLVLSSFPNWYYHDQFLCHFVYDTRQGQVRCSISEVKSFEFFV